MLQLSVLLIMVVTTFGLPLSSALSDNKEYKPLSELNNWEAENPFPVYEYDFFTPELIWDYQGVIPVIKNEGKFNWPQESTFGVLVAEDHLEDFKKDFEGYELKAVESYDMNPKGKPDRSHKTRLARTLYLVRKLP